VRSNKTREHSEGPILTSTLANTARISYEPWHQQNIHTMHTLHTTNKPHETTNHNLQSPDEQQELSHMGVHSSTPAGSMTEMYKYKHKLKISAYDKTRGTKNERFIIVLFISLHSCAMQSVRCLLNK
jgi:hypothetical protein